MKFNPTSILNTIAIRTRTVQLTLGIMAGITIGLGVQVVTAWTGPDATPPDDNAEAPLTVKLNSQFKQGSLWLNTGTDITTGAGALANGLIVAQGKVGIGTLSPNAKLEINSNTVEANVVLSSFSPRMGAGGYQHATDMLFWNKKDSKYWVLGTRGSSGLEADGAHIAYCGSSNPDGSCNTEWKRPFNLTPEGNVGIGTINPNSPLQVAASPNSAGYSSTASFSSDNGEPPYMNFYHRGSRYGFLQSGASDGWNGNPGSNTILAAVSGSDLVLATDPTDAFSSPPRYDLVINNSSSFVGVGYTNPSYKLDVDGHVRSSNGVLTSSDIRLKKDIVTLSNPLEKILNLRGVNYKWKDENKSKDLQVGLIAQEVEAEFPEVVSSDNEGMKSVNYAALVAPLIEAVKEQQKEIQALEEQVRILQEHN